MCVVCVHMRVCAYVCTLLTTDKCCTQIVALQRSFLCEITEFTAFVYNNFNSHISSPKGYSYCTMEEKHVATQMSKAMVNVLLQ